MYRLPAESTATPDGNASCALVAGPPSPEKPCVPFPATIVSVPLGVIRTTRLLSGSAPYTLPAESAATLLIRPRGALIADSGWLGKLKLVPATVVITCAGTEVTQTKQAW